jgi:hypothetical protein
VADGDGVVKVSLLDSDLDSVVAMAERVDVAVVALTPHRTLVPGSRGIEVMVVTPSTAALPIPANNDLRQVSLAATGEILATREDPREACAFPDAENSPLDALEALVFVETLASRAQASSWCLSPPRRFEAAWIVERRKVLVSGSDRGGCEGFLTFLRRRAKRYSSGMRVACVILSCVGCAAPY